MSKVSVMLRQLRVTGSFRKSNFDRYYLSNPQECIDEKQQFPAGRGYAVFVSPFCQRCVATHQRACAIIPGMTFTPESNITTMVSDSRYLWERPGVATHRQGGVNGSLYPVDSGLAGKPFMRSHSIQTAHLCRNYGVAS